MKRVHSRSVLKKNASSYFRAVENLLNNSYIKSELPEMISKLDIIDNDKYEFINEQGDDE
jgi:hypothetical protein